MSIAPVMTRKSRSPLPGQPLANVENSRCTMPLFRLKDWQKWRKAGNWERRTPLLGEIKFDDSAFQGECDSMGSIVRAQLFEDIRNMRLHRLLPDGKLAGDLLIRVSVRDQPED